MEFKFKTSFGSKYQVITPSEDEIKQTKASLADLSGLLPPEIKPEEDPDLLYIVGNLAVPGLVNLNDDYLTPQKAVEVYKKFEKKLCDVEHNRNHLNGFILKSYLTNFDNKQITEEEAINNNQPFYITTIAVLWKIANKDLCNLIIEAANPANPNYNKLSLSFEVGFYSYDIGITSKDRNAINAQIVKEEDEDFAKFDKILRVNGGSGVTNKENDIVFRILKEGVIPLGQGIVGVPAAQVKGIEIITQSIKNLEDDSEDSDSDEVEEVEESKNSEDMEKEDDKEENEKEEDETEKSEPEKESEIELSPEQLINIIRETIKLLIVDDKIFNKSIKNSVSTIINYNIMDKLQELESSWEEVKTKPAQEVFANVRQILAEEISKASEDFSKKQQEDKAAAEILAKAKEDAEKLQKETAAQLETMKAELQAIKDAQASAQKENDFNEHMSLIDQTFDFEEDEMALITAEVRDMDKESFAKWFEKSKKLMKEKTKAFKKEKKEAMEKKLCDAGIKASFDEKTLDFKEILASATIVDTNAAAINTVGEIKKESILDLAKRAFGTKSE